MIADTPGSRRLLVLNGPNLNLLGTREPQVYGTATLADVEKLTTEAATAHGWSAECVQSNHEGALIDAVHAARDTADAIIINPGGYSHTSVALRDALAGVALPVVEVHITNIHKREQFRHHSYISGVADAVIAGAGIAGYRLAVEYLAEVL
ncbi:type II 3-dehydroquinate dehydratase [Arthrobacter sulfonylureivorans]|uniref:3-dehydroquinate dehydratase n=1 Tax=Arthrobacter sulfonylureivorans TaxID=2486855 RepID=A0ABY3W897_9MICC|nr:type II 3-dehydroquinate dehydratase [Arthrobacter sulfonylureivorans]UNK46560.1 type II 3-dehydroquinate dehydratase [Arthrobacter sulfonylureivorans]